MAEKRVEIVKIPSSRTHDKGFAHIFLLYLELEFTIFPSESFQYTEQHGPSQPPPGKTRWYRRSGVRAAISKVGYAFLVLAEISRENRQAG
jgi:hypothetical protein